MDDLPVGLFKTQEAAEQFARTVSIKYCKNTALRCDISMTEHVCFFVCQFKAGNLLSANQFRRPDDAI